MARKPHSAGAPANNQNAVKSGAFAYLRRTEEGRLIPANLALVESQVIDDVETGGPTGRIWKAAVRMATAGDLLWNYMTQGPSEFTHGLKHWGWLVNSEVRAWREFLKARGDTRGGDLLDGALKALTTDDEGEADDDEAQD
jgi:hypothetical protein